MPLSVFLCPSPEGQARSETGFVWLGVGGWGARMVALVFCVLLIPMPSLAAAFSDFSVLTVFFFSLPIPLSLCSQTHPSHAGCQEGTSPSCQVVAVGFHSVSSSSCPQNHPNSKLCPYKGTCRGLDRPEAVSSCFGPHHQ